MIILLSINLYNFEIILSYCYYYLLTNPCYRINLRNTRAHQEQ